MSKILIDEATVKLSLEALGLYARTLAPTETQKKGLEAINALNEAQAQPQQEPVAMRMPKVGDKVVCIEDESFGTVVYLTAGGSPEIKFDDGSHGTYMLREFAELFGYTPPAAPLGQWQDKPAPWHHRILKAHPESQPEFWPDHLRLKYVTEELEEYRAAFATPPAAQPSPVQEPVADRLRIVEGLLLKFQSVASNVARTHQKYMGKAMDDETYAHFAKARDETIPALRAELINLYTTPPAAAVQSLPFGVGGGLVAIKTLLSRDPCVHANTAIEMIDAILKEHPAAQPATEKSSAVQQQPVQQGPGRTDREIVDQTEELAGLLMRTFHRREKADPLSTFQGTQDIRASQCWQIACQIQEMLTDTDPMNAVAEVDDEAAHGIKENT